MSPPPTFSVRFWGVRGTVPSPGLSTLRYGGNTPCVEMTCGDEQLIFDAGTGIRMLGRRMIETSEKRRSNVFLSHTHVDHINGFAFFKPVYMAGNSFRFWNGHLLRLGTKLSDVLSSVMRKPFFPVPLEIMHACVGFEDFNAGETLEPSPGIVMRTHLLPHPGGATAYRVEFADKTICYVTDVEHVPGQLDQGVLDLIAGADIVIYDSTYCDSEFETYRGWGHSTWQQGVRLCRAAGAGRLVTFHHEPDRTDDQLDEIGRALEHELPGSLVAREGLVLSP